jgi:UDP-N-acetylglucosamine 2-epimerase
MKDIVKQKESAQGKQLEINKEIKVNKKNCSVIIIIYHEEDSSLQRMKRIVFCLF